MAGERREWGASVGDGDDDEGSGAAGGAPTISPLFDDQRWRGRGGSGARRWGTATTMRGAAPRGGRRPFPGGAAMGFSQVGLLPIIEIPYAKYLDCGADMFYELAISNWLTNKQRPNGMVIRIQGFDRGRESILFALYYTVQQRSTFFLFSFRRKLPYAQHDITRSSGGGCGVL